MIDIHGGRQLGGIKLNRAQFRNLCWYHLTVVDLMMYQCHTMDEVSTNSKKESLNALLHDITDFMKPSMPLRAKP